MSESEPGVTADGPPRPWWRLTLRDAILLPLLALVIAFWYWPLPPAAPVEVLQQGTVGGASWSVLVQRADARTACLQVRVGGARRARMCDQHWDRDVHRLWHGARPSSAGAEIGPPSLLRVAFPGTDRMLVVSVLYGEIATLSPPPRDGSGPVVLHTVPLLDTEFHYVVAVIAAADAKDLEAYAADGEELFYHYVEGPPPG
ncbi:hypothetical protein [Krasilnikovia sp. MM14-A1259]|uniref:hypothetical protein n=1 Tax=Krasilnikovia sp. MM14-A1259 TaxID=3373539 RepID=UPI00382A4247